MATDLDRSEARAAPQSTGRRTAAALLRALRPHHAIKNLLVFTPMLFAAEAAAWPRLVTAFLCFGLLTGGTYLVNDVLDREADRAHPHKRRRPIARGDLSIPLALGAAGVLAAASFAAAAALGARLVAVLAAYLVLTLAYSLGLKRVPPVAVATLGVLFALRIAGGATLVETPHPALLAAFAVPFFAGLAIVKRVADDRTGHGRRAIAWGIAAHGVALAALAAFLVATSGGRVLPWVAAALLVIWLVRIWRLAAARAIAGDPVAFVLRDGPSLALGAATLGCLVGDQWLGV